MNEATLQQRNPPARSIDALHAEARASWFSLVAILAATALLYLPALRYAFVYDDRYQILRNPRITSWRYFGSYFTHHVWIHQSAAGSYYRPLFLVWLRLNDALFGEHPLGWHATTILLHLAAVAMVYLLLRRTIADAFVVNVATIVFAIHPVHIESVAWISGLTDPLMAVPLLGSLLCWLSYRDRKDFGWLLASLVLMVLALFAKETAGILPGLIFLYAYSLSDAATPRLRLRDAYRNFVPYFFVLALFWALRTALLFREHLPLNRGLRDIIVNTPAMSWFYGSHLSWPARVGIYYDFVPLEWRWSRVPLGVACVLLVLLIGFLAVRRSGNLLVAWAWIVFPVATVIASLPVFFSPHDIVHDRYLYLAAIGFGILCGDLLRHIPPGSHHAFGQPLARILVTIVTIGLLTFSLLTQMPQWHDDLALFQQAVRTAPHNPNAYNDLGYQLFLRNRLEEARTVYAKDQSLFPNEIDANTGLALMSFQLDRWNDAVEACHRVDTIEPLGRNSCYVIEGRALQKLGRLQEAEADARFAIEHWPKLSGEHLLLGRILAAEGNLPGARQEFLAELKIDEKSGAAQDELKKLPGAAKLQNQKNAPNAPHRLSYDR